MTTNGMQERPKILIVDKVRTSLGEILEASQFRITTASGVEEALRLIDTEPFDVLLCDLNMPGVGDGFNVVSAMRHKNPDAVTLVFAGYPAVENTMEAILLQADGMRLTPMSIPALIAIIHEKMQKRERGTNIERVAAILERDSSATISDWLLRVEREIELTRVPLSKEQRTGHLSKLLEELIQRLRVPRSLGSKEASEAAAQHGRMRHAQGYSVPMIVEESRILQVSLFQSLQNNLSTVDFNLLLLDVMHIADEVDSQLKQTIISFTAQAATA